MCAHGALQQGMPFPPLFALGEDPSLILTGLQLAFRQTVHKYGVDLCWTPMILAKEFNRSSFARDSGEPPQASHGQEAIGRT